MSFIERAFLSNSLSEELSTLEKHCSLFNKFPGNEKNIYQKTKHAFACSELFCNFSQLCREL